MNFQKLLDSCGGPGDEFEYYKEIVTRIAGILGEHLSHDQGIALLQILTLYSFKFTDGFVINDDRDRLKVMGYADAASVVASFWDDPAKDWEWTRHEYWACDKSNAEYQSLKKSLVSQLLADPTIQEREFGEP